MRGIIGGMGEGRGVKNHLKNLVTLAHHELKDVIRVDHDE